MPFVVLFLLACVLPLAAQEPSPEERERKILGIFDLLGLPDVRGKTFVRFNPGDWIVRGNPEALRFRYRVGWILSESQDEITLLQVNTIPRTLPRKRRLPPDWESFKDKHPRDRPPPGDYMKVDFDDYCKECVAAGLQRSYEDMLGYRDYYFYPGVDDALFAWWELVRGKPRIADALFRLAEEYIVREDRNRWSKRTAEDLTAQALADEIATNQRWQAISGANKSSPIEEVLAHWEMIASLPRNACSQEATEMIGACKAFIAEGRTWKTLSRSAVLELPRAQQAEYWMHALRDHTAMQMSNPGECSVLGWPPLPNPADELVKLGWDALPVVIEHIDDARPTRCVGFHRSCFPDSWYLLRYGDCCKQIFEAIRWVENYETAPIDRHMVEEGRAPAVKAAALAWWREHRDEGPERYYTAILEGPHTGAHSFAAEALLNFDEAKYVPRLIEKVSLPGVPARIEILQVLAPHLGKEHEEFLQGLLGDASPEIVLIAAEARWKKCGSDAGAREWARRLDGALEGKLGLKDFYLGSGLWLLSSTGGDYATDIETDLLRRPYDSAQREALNYAACFHCRRIAEALVAMLGRQEDTGCGLPPLRFRVCDRAAEELSRMLEDAGAPKATESTSQRDPRIAEMRAWWKVNADTIDWEALRRAWVEKLRKASDSSSPQK